MGDIESLDYSSYELNVHSFPFDSPSSVILEGTKHLKPHTPPVTPSM